MSAPERIGWPRRAFCAALGGALLGCASASPAQETGRYEAVPVTQGGRSGESGALTPKVLIIDTRDGHLWTWSENELLSADSSAQRRYGAALIYQGQVRPGSRVGEVIAK